MRRLRRFLRCKLLFIESFCGRDVIFCACEFNVVIEVLNFCYKVNLLNLSSKVTILYFSFLFFINLINLFLYSVELFDELRLADMVTDN